MNTIFRKVLVSERIPKRDDTFYHTDVGFIDFDLKNGWMDCNKDPQYPDWWLEEIELPTDEEILGFSFNYRTTVQQGEGFIKGATFIRDGYLADCVRD